MKSGHALQPIDAGTKQNCTAGEGHLVAGGGRALHTPSPRTRFIKSVVRRRGTAGDGETRPRLSIHISLPFVILSLLKKKGGFILFSFRLRP